MRDEADATPKGTTTGPERDAETEMPTKRGWKAAFAHEVKAHPFGYVVLALFVLAGPVGVALLFPQAPIGVVVVGGLAFGIYAALCAVPEKFI